MIAQKALLAGRRQFRQLGADFIDPALGNC